MLSRVWGVLIFCGKSVGGDLGALKDSSLPLPARVDVPAAFLPGMERAARVYVGAAGEEP